MSDLAPKGPPPSADRKLAETAPELVPHEAYKIYFENNPGSYEELHRKTRDIFPMCFEGAKFMVQKGLSSHFQVAHTISISSANTGYRFGATYIGKQEYTPGESFPVMLGDVDGSGNTSATVIHQPTKNWRFKFQGQTQKSAISAAQGTIERRGRLSTASIMLGNTDLINNSGVIVGHYLRRLTQGLDIGAELVYQYGKSIPGGGVSILSYALRYTAAKWALSSTFGSSGAHVCYYHKESDGLQFGVEFESNFRMSEAVTTFAYQAELPEAGVTMRASCDTNWTVGAVFEKKLSPTLPFTLAISGLLNHVKAQGKFGVGLIIG
uniref:Mitochondrial import receptor subunit TOM40 n=1 Tax=Panagrolaimus sp. JU765 TaxID=591449 RepID=A0AC34RIN1_9BILA